MQPSAWAERPDYRVDVLRRRNRVTVRYDGEVLAESTGCLLVDEQDHGLVFYVPREDVRMELLVRSALETRCPFKGQATHYVLAAGGGPERLAWSYEDPYPEVARIAGYVAFYQDNVSLEVGQAPYNGPR
jgi:uncharacterized protein (DUF427 family)